MSSSAETAAPLLARPRSGPLGVVSKEDKWLNSF